MSSMFYELYPNKTFFFPLKNGFTELKTYSSQKIRGRLPYREEKKDFLVFMQGIRFAKGMAAQAAAPQTA